MTAGGSLRYYASVSEAAVAALRLRRQSTAGQDPEEVVRAEKSCRLRGR